MTPPCALFVGGVRSGKSGLAQQWAEARALRRLYVATGEPADAEMAERVRRHRAARGPEWACLEEPLDVAAALDALWAGKSPTPPAAGRPGVVLLDCVSMWLANLLGAGLDDGAVLGRVDGLAASLSRRTLPVAVVTAEAGLGLVPPSPLPRRFLDLLGLANQRLARAAEPVIFVTCGLPLALRGRVPRELESRP
ncbi:MAG: bifunctional adenosylcobinamide kinase/adenosylcobinamide-phosphate guanylyltransferase [Desulfovibrio sp.]|uniref:bifunctional adenosylcobinamide kinase/adenosylcobinamide-phosphate guanylyltransferase n=1 Tax=Desulfovibrio sp. TaxID=885 RepID=UPI001A792DDD|nr:bifunctional adenosylcobinamide kinase/adenosylcobinamide-phosphate guanylyltransferase [Desulfovibrio sp.]MBD5416811.1 bifunctional adenosylcobinamide kinase/adenosylcobinamide-phosphate guanylyltransferase [Desulfovibrio sp.]